MRKIEQACAGRHTRDSLVRGVVIRQNAALVFMMGLGEVDLTAMPCATAMCRARCALCRNSLTHPDTVHRQSVAPVSAASALYCNDADCM